MTCRRSAALLAAIVWLAGPALAAVIDPTATLKRNADRCSAQGDLTACYDAVRRKPGDASLLVALGDALVRAKRPNDAVRNYRRAAALAPSMRNSIAAKIAIATATATATATAATEPGPKRVHYSNAAPETNSH